MTSIHKVFFSKRIAEVFINHSSIMREDREIHHSN
jgi:hypothetical protein